MPKTQLTKTLPISPVASELNAASADSATVAKAANRTVSDRSASAYVNSNLFGKLAFIACLLVATVFHRSVAMMARIFEGLFGKVQTGGAELIPETGSFTLVVNHFNGAWTPYVTAAILAAVRKPRPDAVNDLAVIIGQRTQDKKRFIIARMVRRVVLWVLDRWQHNLLRIPLGNKEVSIDSLRTWKRVAKVRPTLVYPEGLASITFEKVRSGAGQFARSLDVPCVPCAVWWHQGQWHVEFDAPIVWADNKELSDLQVGLSIAKLLPAELTPHWRGVLARWNRAHEDASA